MDYFGTSFEIKTVDTSARIIAGMAARHSNLDKVRDIIDPAASVKAVRRLGSLSDVACFIGHDSSALPVGIPQKIEATADGLYTETYILKGPAGDNLLAVAKDLEAHGQSLGMSIGYQTQESRPERSDGKMVRRILDYVLKEYSYAAPQVIANPRALVSAVKARSKALSEGSDTAGGALVDADRKDDDDSYRIEARGDRFHIIEGDGTSLIDFGTQLEANAALAALNADAGEDASEEDEMAGKTLSLLRRPMTKADFDALTNSEKMALHAELLAVGAL